MQTMTDQKQESTSTNLIQLPSRHHKNFQTYITEYAQRNGVAMSGPVWETALAAAQRLDYKGIRATFDTQLIISRSQAPAGGVVRRVLGRLFRRTTPSVPAKTAVMTSVASALVRRSLWLRSSHDGREHPIIQKTAFFFTIAPLSR